MAPDFELPDETGVLHKLSDYRGKDVVLYFTRKMVPPAAQPRPAIFEMITAPMKKPGSQFWA